MSHLVDDLVDLNPKPTNSTQMYDQILSLNRSAYHACTQIRWDGGIRSCGSGRRITHFCPYRHPHWRRTDFCAMGLHGLPRNVRTFPFDNPSQLMDASSPGVIRGLMGYIVDLTIVMQSLFWLVQAGNGTNAVRPRLLKLAVAAYLESGDRARVHEEIKTFVTSSTAFKIGQKDRVLEKVVQLIHSHRFEPPDDFKDIAQQSANIWDEEEGWA